MIAENFGIRYCRMSDRDTYNLIIFDVRIFFNLLLLNWSTKTYCIRMLLHSIVAVSVLALHFSFIGNNWVFLCKVCISNKLFLHSFIIKSIGRYSKYYVINLWYVFPELEEIILFISILVFSIRYIFRFVFAFGATCVEGFSCIFLLD